MRRAWESGQRVIKCIGFDATEDHRAKGGGGTYAVGKMKLSPEPGMPDYADRYDVDYPLRRWGMTRQLCIEEIRSVGLPVPCKSACFMCPASKSAEVRRMAEVAPAYYLLSVAMEVLYRMGHHHRGDNHWVVKARRKDTGERSDFECFAASSADARAQFRIAYNDTATPYRYQLDTNPGVSGIAYGKPWLLIPAKLPELYRERLERFLDRYGHPHQIDNKSLPVLE